MAQDGEIRSALDQAQRTPARRPLSADHGAGEALPASTRCCPRSGRRWRRWSSPVTGRIHAHYRIASTASGRASCAGPNLQQVPRDPRFRALFVPEPGNVFVIADYASMEMRAAAYISGDIAMSEAFEQGLDLHRLTASRMTGKIVADVTDEERKGAKGVNFGTIYGQGAAASSRAPGSNSTSSWIWMKPRHGCRRSRTPIRLARWRREHYGRCEERGYIVIGKDMADTGSAGSTPRAGSRRRVVLHALLQSADSGRLRRRFDAGARLCRRSAVRRRH